MKTVEQKKIERLPRYIKNKELEDLLDSEEMKKLVKQIKEIEEYKRKTRYVYVGEY